MNNLSTGKQLVLKEKDSSLRLAVGRNQSAYADFTLQSRETNDYTHFYIVYI